MLELLAKQHDDWIRIAYNMTDDMDAAKDLVQDMYIRLHRLGKTREDVAYKDTVNRYFIWTVMFNMYKVSMRPKVHKKIDTCALLGNEQYYDERYKDIDYQINKDQAFNMLNSRIKDIISDWKPYDKKLFDLYFMRGQSLRQIARGTSIGLSSIHNSVKGYREILRHELSEDLQDYFNQDYNKII